MLRRGPSPARGRRAEAGEAEQHHRPGRRLGHRRCALERDIVVEAESLPRTAHGQKKAERKSGHAGADGAEIEARSAEEGLRLVKIVEGEGRDPPAGLDVQFETVEARSAVIQKVKDEFSWRSPVPLEKGRVGIFELFAAAP
jgi:hypothetical protein